MRRRSLLKRIGAALSLAPLATSDSEALNDDAAEIREPATSNGAGRTVPDDEPVGFRTTGAVQTSGGITRSENPGCHDNPLVEGNRCEDDDEGDSTPDDE